MDDDLHRGGRNAVEVHRRLQSDGIRTAMASVQRFVARRLAALGKSPKCGPTESSKPPWMSMWQMTFEVAGRVEKRGQETTTRVTAVRGVADLAAE